MSRRRAHVAMIGIPAVSHVLPSLEIIRELVARGHRVTYANDPAVAGLIEATGAEFVPFESVLPVADNNWPDDPIAAMGVFLDDAIQALPRLRAVYDDDPADLYLYDIGAYPGRALAEAQGRPLMQLSPTFVAWEGYEQDVAAQLWQLPGADEYRARFARWLADCGATTTDMDAFCGRPAHSLAMIPRAMQPHADRVDTDTVTFVGPCFGARADEGAWTRPAGEEKVLLVSLGSAFTRQPEFYRQCLAAYGNLPGWHVVLQIGKYTDPAELGDIPPNVEVHSWVPQLTILEQADAFVTHAGMGGSSEGLFTGVPMIAVPQAAEQFINADRLVELGVARRIDTEEATAE
ncbi:macrolide family glycosyltransferase, partial [Streptomyces sp. NPDC006510]|uniref:macrolide family glycosyltransferase n=1 Tax=Streptomyces sp. NPDC006510 TaxID=3155600 RepID=UPI0033BC926A